MKRETYKTPADLIREDLERLQLNQVKFAAGVQVDPSIISHLVNSNQSVTPLMSERLAAFTGRDPREYFNAQCEVWWAERTRVQIKQPKAKRRKQ